VPPVTFVFGFADFRAFLVARRAASPIAPYRPLLMMALWVFWFGLTLFLISSFDLGTDSLRPLAAMVPVGLAILAFYIFLRERWEFRQLLFADQPVTVMFGEQAVQWTGRGFALSCDWSRIVKVFLHDGYLTLFTSRRVGLPIPRRAVGSDEAFAALAAFARERAGG
jgi:hypothetical protein